MTEQCVKCAFFRYSVLPSFTTQNKWINKTTKNKIRTNPLQELPISGKTDQWKIHILKHIHTKINFSTPTTRNKQTILITKAMESTRQIKAGHAASTLTLGGTLEVVGGQAGGYLRSCLAVVHLLLQVRPGAQGDSWVVLQTRCILVAMAVKCNNDYDLYDW